MSRKLLGWLCVLALAVPGGALAQAAAGWDPTGLQLTRAELEQMLERFEATSKSSAYSGATRDQAKSQTALIRQRLADGDIRVGDRILLVVEGQQQLSDTFNVVAGRKLVLPDIGDVPLEGVLRSELQPHLLQHLTRFLREPVVHARSLIRLEIGGSVAQPGFYTVPSDMPITDVLMLAGGPANNAQLNRLRITRGDATIWDGNYLRDAVIEGRTLDQLSVRAGDALYVPASGSRMQTVRNGMVVLTTITSLLLIATRLNVF